VIRSDAAVLLALAAVLLAACSGASMPRAPAAEPYIRGPLESLTHHATASGLLVRSAPGTGDSCGIMATVDASTRYLARTRSGALRNSSLAELSEGDTVELYVRGPVMLSCPAQGKVSTVVLIATGQR
jgi:hypothetical protein